MFSKIYVWIIGAASSPRKRCIHGLTVLRRRDLRFWVGLTVLRRRDWKAARSAAIFWALLGCFDVEFWRLDCAEAAGLGLRRRGLKKNSQAVFTPFPRRRSSSALHKVRRPRGGPARPWTTQRNQEKIFYLRGSKAMRRPIMYPTKKPRTGPTSIRNT